MGLIGVGIGQAGAEIGGGIGRKMRRQHDARAQRRQPRVGIAQAVFAVDAVPPQTAITPSTSDRSSQITLARSL